MKKELIIEDKLEGLEPIEMRLELIIQQENSDLLPLTDKNIQIKLKELIIVEKTEDKPKERDK